MRREIGVAMLVVSGFVAIAAEAPSTKPATLAIDDLRDEIANQVAAIEQLLQRPEVGPAERKEIASRAVPLSLIAQGWGESLEKQDSRKDQPVTAFAIREAARTLQGQRSVEELRETVQRMQTLLKEGAAETEKPASRAWSELASLRSRMGQFESRVVLLRGSLRKQMNVEENSSQATVLAVFARSLHQPPKSINTDEERQLWESFAREMEQSFIEMSAKMKQRDVLAARDHFAEGMEFCSKCHSEFRQ